MSLDSRWSASIVCYTKAWNYFSVNPVEATWHEVQRDSLSSQGDNATIRSSPDACSVISIVSTDGGRCCQWVAGNADTPAFSSVIMFNCLANLGYSPRTPGPYSTFNCACTPTGICDTARNRRRSAIATHRPSGIITSRSHRAQRRDRRQCQKFPNRGRGGCKNTQRVTRNASR